MANVSDKSSDNKINIVTNVENNVTVTQRNTDVVTVNALGPRGPQGPQGIQGPPGSGAVEVDALNEFTASAQTSIDALNIFTGSKDTFTNITASGDISSSGTVKAFTGSFGRLEGLSPITIGDSIIFEQPVTGSIFSGSFVGDITLALPSGLLSGSAQIATEISGAFASPFTSAGISGSFTTPSSSISTRITTLENNPTVASGTISSSLQITQLGFVTSSSTASFVTNSQTGSFLTSLPSGVLSGSAQIATEISGAFASPFTSAGITGSFNITSASFSTRVTTLEAGGVSIPVGTVSSSAQLATEISGAFAAPSASFSTRVTTLEAGGGGGSGIFTDSNGFKVTDNNLIISSSGAKQLSSSLSVQGSGSAIFDVQGSVGQLFEVQDGLDGVLMSVNDISGIPILTVSSSGNIIIPDSSRLIGTASVALSVPGATAAFPFTGNALITGELDITGSGDDIFKVRSKSGSLFSVDDGLDGILMSVNDISGLPLFEVDSSGNVEIYEGNVSGSSTSTGSFGHIIGDGSQLSNLPAATLPTGVLSGSAQIASDISGSFTATSSSLASRTSTLEGAGYITSAFPFTGDAVITGSLIVSGSFNAFRIQTNDVLLGDGAGNNTSVNANGNVMVGYQAGYTNTTGDKGVVIGYQAGYNLGTNASDQNVLIGNEAGKGGGVTTGGYAYNVFLGTQAGYYMERGDENVGIGAYALRLNQDGHRNIAIGRSAIAATLGNDNIGIGRLAGSSQTTGTGNITIGSGSLGVAGESNQLRIGNGNTLTTISASLETGDIIFASTASAAYFVGNGSGLTNLPSSFTSAGISGSFTAPSASLSTRVTTNTTNISTNTSNISSNLTKINSLASVTSSYATTASVNLQDLTISNLSGSLIPGDGSTISYPVTVVNSGGDKFAIDVGSGVQTTPAFSLMAGNTYRFTQEDGTNNNHPFGFSVASTDADYTDDVTYNGTAGQAGSYAQIIVSNSTPNLKYRCTVHGIGMGGGAIITIITGSQIENGFLTVSGSVNITGSFNLNGLNFDTAVSSSAAASGFGSGGGGGSSFTAAGISGSFTAPSASFSTRVTTLEAGGGGGTPTFIASGSTSASADPGTGIVVNHSGSTAFSVIGDTGTLFSVDDSLTGTLFSANDISGFPVLQADATGEVYIGKSPQSLYTTAVVSSTNASESHSLCTLSTSSYDGAFFEYTAHKGSNARAGNIMSIWNGSNIVSTETTSSQIGDTTDLTTEVIISGSTARLIAYGPNAGYKIKTIIKAI